MSKRIAKDTVGSAEFKARCLELIDRVKEARAEFVVTRHGKPVARLVPVEPEQPVSPLGVMRGTVLTYERPYHPVPGTWSLDAGEGQQD
jgi:prevent-host-death family protein